MSFKLGTVDGKAVLIKGDFYYDISSLSNGSIALIVGAKAPI